MPSRPCLVRRLLAVAAVGLLLAAAAAPAGAWLLDRFAAQEVQMIAPRPAEVVKLNRTLWEEGDPVAEIYGLPTGEPTRVVLAAGDRLFRPAEDPSLLLLRVDKQAGQNPLQARTVWFVAWRAAGAALLGGLLSLGGVLLWRRRTPSAGCRREAEPA